jgi:hypothetical protein
VLPELREEDEEALWWKRGLTWEAYFIKFP